MKKSLIILLGAVLLSVLGFLGLKAGGFNQTEHAAFQTALWQVKHLDTTFNEDILEARFGLMNNYDDFGTCTLRLQQNLEVFKKMPAFITPQGRLAIENARSEY